MRRAIGHRLADALTTTALTSLGERQSTWRPAVLVRELAAAVPTTMALDSAELTETLDRFAGDVASTRCVDISRSVPPGGKLRRDGRPTTESSVDRALTTRAILDEEEELVAWAQRRMRQPEHDPAVSAPSGISLQGWRRRWPQLVTTQSSERLRRLPVLHFANPAMP